MHEKLQRMIVKYVFVFIRLPQLTFASRNANLRSALFRLNAKIISRVFKTR